MTQQEDEQLLTSSHQVHRSIDSRPDRSRSARVRSGTHTGARSPERCRIVSFSESRRSVWMRSPGLRGIIDGAATVALVFKATQLPMASSDLAVYEPTTDTFALNKIEQGLPFLFCTCR
jgi:hypothetical protein